MLDRIHMFIPFKTDAIRIMGRDDRSPTLVVDLDSLGVPVRAGGVSKREDGGYDCEQLSHAWESLPSSYTPMAFKVFHQSHGKRLNPGVEMKASPAKLLQGHNVFGPTSLRLGAEEMIKWLAGTYPDLYAQLDVLQAEAYALDCTYSARSPDERTSLQLIQSLRGVSNGQTRNRGDDYETTAYWGSKETRLRKLKAYLKWPEFQRQFEELKKSCSRVPDVDPEPRQDLMNAHVRAWKLHLRRPQEIHAFAASRTFKVMSDPRLHEWAKNLIRLEATVMHRWLERRGIPTNIWALCDYQEHLLREQGICLIQQCWEAVTKELFAAFEGIQMRVINDEKVLAALLKKFTKEGKGKWTKERIEAGVVVPPIFVPGKPSESYARNLFRTYRSLKDYGWEETMNSMARRTFYDHVRDLCEVGLSKAVLQKLKLDDAKNNVVPILRFLQVDFGAQRPDWYVEPEVA